MQIVSHTKIECKICENDKNESSDRKICEKNLQQKNIVRLNVRKILQKIIPRHERIVSQEKVASEICYKENIRDNVGGRGG